MQEVLRPAAGRRSLSIAVFRGEIVLFWRRAVDLIRMHVVGASEEATKMRRAYPHGPKGRAGRERTGARHSATLDA